MDNLTISEGRTTRGVGLTSEEATLLNAAGKQLVADPWWNADDGDERRSIWCEEEKNGWAVHAGNVVGAVGLGDRSLLVSPKVSVQTLLYLGQRSGVFPRMGSQQASLSSGENFADLVASWLVFSTKRLLNSGLHQAYEATEQDAETLLGSVVPLPTALNFYSGKLQFHCVADEFTLDNPLNRILLEALTRVMHMAGVRVSLRHEVRGLISAFAGVGSLQQNDIEYQLDRNQQRYATTLTLALQVISRTGRNLKNGSHSLVTFLLPTPSLVENGIMAVLKEHLPKELFPWKREKKISPSFGIDPDLRFGDPVRAVGDVKYRLYTNKWKRTEVFQLTSYAAGFSVKRALLIGFSTNGGSIQDLHMGNHILRTHLWNASDGADPEYELELLIEQINLFMGGQSPTFENTRLPGNRNQTDLSSISS